jgi:hypothetical protein
MVGQCGIVFATAAIGAKLRAAQSGLAQPEVVAACEPERLRHGLCSALRGASLKLWQTGLKIAVALSRCPC